MVTVVVRGLGDMGSQWGIASWLLLDSRGVE